MSTDKVLPDSIEDYIHDLSKAKCPEKLGFKFQTKQLDKKICIPMIGQRSKQTMYCCKDIDTCFANANIMSVLLQFPDIHTFVMQVVLNSNGINSCKVWVITKTHGRIDFRFANPEIKDKELMYKKQMYIHKCMGKLANFFKESSGITKKLEIHYPNTDFFNRIVEQHGTKFFQYEISANHFLKEFKLSLFQMKYNNIYSVDYTMYNVQ